MNIPLVLHCPACGELHRHRVHLSDPTADFTCVKCRVPCTSIPSLDVTVGVLLLARSWHELEIEKDYDMAIVLAAMALECELSRLYCKWKEVEALDTGPFDLEQSEEELRKMGSVAEKITKVSAFVCEGGIEAFAAASDKWKTISNRFPTLHLGSLAIDFQREVFWPRNTVLHQAKTGKTKDEADSCCSIAEVGIHILKDIDKARLRVFERSH